MSRRDRGREDGIPAGWLGLHALRDVIESLADRLRDLAARNA